MGVQYFYPVHRHSIQIIAIIISCGINLVARQVFFALSDQLPSVAS